VPIATSCDPDVPMVARAPGLAHPGKCTRWMSQRLQRLHRFIFLESAVSPRQPFRRADSPEVETPGCDSETPTLSSVRDPGPAGDGGGGVRGMGAGGSGSRRF
jgi:hypothetical protein